MPPNCFGIVQRRFRRRSPKATRSSSTEEAIVKEETIKVEDSNGAASSTPSSQKEELTKEDVAAVKIQAIFRGHRVLHPSLNLDLVLNFFMIIIIIFLIFLCIDNHLACS
jgi:hypothetical protein